VAWYLSTDKQCTFDWAIKLSPGPFLTSGRSPVKGDPRSCLPTQWVLLEVTEPVLVPDTNFATTSYKHITHKQLFWNVPGTTNVDVSNAKKLKDMLQTWKQPYHYRGPKCIYDFTKRVERWTTYFPNALILCYFAISLALMVIYCRYKSDVEKLLASYAPNNTVRTYCSAFRSTLTTTKNYKLKLYTSLRFTHYATLRCKV
jgi:hypothetical protein